MNLTLSFSARSDIGSFSIVLIGLVVGVGLLLFLTRRGRMLDALRLTFSHPAFLVPPAMVTAALVLFVADLGPLQTVHENPFGAYGSQRYGRSAPLNWAVLLIVAVGLAGQVGLLHAHAAGHKPGSRWFASGVVDHTATFALGKLAVAAVLYWITMLGPETIGWILVLAPSVLIAPLIGTSARHPRDPAAAFAACLGISSKDIAGVGRVVTAQALFVYGVFILYDQWSHPLRLMPSLLGFSSSTLSYNHFPLLLLQRDQPLDILAIALTVLGSSVFVTAHYLGATRGYASATERAG